MPEVLQISEPEPWYFAAPSDLHHTLSIIETPSAMLAAQEVTTHHSPVQ
jgi:hypothetical protein